MLWDWAALGAIFAWLAALILGAVVTVVLQEPVHRALIKWIGLLLPKQRRSLTGIWISQYTYRSGNKNIETVQIMELRQVGHQVIGFVLIGKHHRHRISGFFRDAYFTGVWENITEDTSYHG